MPYTPKTWVNGETIFAPDLNHLENQYTQALADVAGTYLRQDTAATTYLSQASALNLYLAKTGGVVSGNLTTQGNVYLGLTTLNQNQLIDFYVPRYYTHGKRFIFGDYQDTAALFPQEPNRTVTFSTAPSAGTAVNLFRDDTSTCNWNAGVNPWPLVITMDASSNYIQGFDQWRVSLTFSDGQTLYIPTTIKVEVDGGTGYSTVFDGALANVGGTCLLPAFTTLTNRVYKLKITLQPVGGYPLAADMSLCRIRLHNAGTAWDTFHVHRQGPQTMFGNLTVEGTIDADAFTINGVAIGSGGGGVSGSGTQYNVPMFSASTTLTNSIISQHSSGGSVTVTGGLNVTSYASVGNASGGGYLHVRGGALEVKEGGLYARDGVSIGGYTTLATGDLQGGVGLIFEPPPQVPLLSRDIGILAKRSSGGNQNGLDFFTGGVSRLSITSSGEVGIGTATANGYKLYVNGAMYALSAVLNGALTATTAMFGADLNNPYTDITATGLRLPNNYPIQVRGTDNGYRDLLKLDAAHNIILGTAAGFNNLSLGAGGAPRMTLLSDGTIGVGTTSTSSFTFYVNGSLYSTSLQSSSIITNGIVSYTNKDVTVGASTLTTNAVAGFLYLPSVAGTPTGTPTTRTGFSPVQFNVSDNKLYVYNGGAWQSLGGAGGGGGGTLTGVTAGSGLTGGGTSGTVSLAIATGGVSDAMLADAKLSLGNGGTMTGGSLTLKRGDNSVASNATINLILELAAGGYKHFVRSRHDAQTSSAGNAIDFYLNNSSTAGGSTGPGAGSVVGLSVNATGVGVGTTATGSYRLNVNGNIYTTTGLVSDGDLVLAGDVRRFDNSGSLRFFASNAIASPATGAQFQLFGNGAAFPGQVYLDSGSHNSANIILRTAQTGAALTERLKITASGNIVMGNAVLPTTATDGYLYLPTTSGTPTGVPTTYTGTAATVFSTSDNKVYVYSSGAWQALGGAGGGGGGGTITGVTAGSGLTGGGTSGTVTLGIGAGSVFGSMLAAGAAATNLGYLPLSAMGGTLTGNLTLDLSGSSTTAPRKILVTNWATGAASRLALAGTDETGLQVAWDYVTQLYSYHGIEIHGATQSGAAVAWRQQTASDAGLTVINSQAGRVALMIKGANSQTANVFETRTQTGTIKTALDASGNLALGADQAYGYKLYVNGSLYGLGGSFAGNISTAGTLTVEPSLGSGSAYLTASSAGLTLTNDYPLRVKNSSGTASDVLKMTTGNVLKLGSGGWGGGTLDLVAGTSGLRVRNDSDTADLATFDTTGGGRLVVSGTLTATGIASLSGGDVTLGANNLTTSSTGGFPYLPSVTGTPTGTPTSRTGYAPAVFNTSDNKLYIYAGGAWQSLGGAGGGGGGTGDIEGVTAGSGLTGGGSSGTVALAIATGGVTDAMLANAKLDLAGGTLTGNLVLNNGAADGGRVQLASQGYTTWEVNNYNGDLRLLQPGVVYVNLSTTWMTVRPGLVIDGASANTGDLSAGSLRFGGTTGQGIASKRSVGGNQDGLDLFTNYLPRLSITNSGAITVGGDLSTAGTLTVEPSLGSGTAYLSVGAAGTTWAHDYPLRLKNSSGTAREVLRMTPSNVLRLGSAGWGGSTVDMVAGNNGVRVRNSTDTGNLATLDGTNGLQLYTDSSAGGWSGTNRIFSLRDNGLVGLAIWEVQNQGTLRIDTTGTTATAGSGTARMIRWGSAGTSDMGVVGRTGDGSLDIIGGSSGFRVRNAADSDTQFQVNGSGLVYVAGTFQTNGSSLLGSSSLTTTSTDGFPYIPSVAGAPTGTPTTQGNRAPHVWDRTNHRLYAYSNSAWQRVGGVQPTCRAYHNASQALAHATWTVLAFNSDRWKTDSTMHDTTTDNSRLYAPMTGRYLVTLAVAFANNATGTRLASITKNNALTYLDTNLPAINGHVTKLVTSTVVDMVAGDYVTASVYQDSGSSLNIESNSAWSPEFSITRID